MTLTLFSGITRRDAQLMFIMLMYDLENYGMTYVQAIISGERVRVAIGAKCIRILTQNWQIKSRYFHFYCTTEYWRVILKAQNSVLYGSPITHNIIKCVSF